MKYLLILAFVWTTQLSLSQTIVQRDPEIEAMVKEVSADSLKLYISKMVSFGTRNTLSSTSNKNQGIGAARNWVLHKFNDFAKSSNGRLTAFIMQLLMRPTGDVWIVPSAWVM